MNPPQADHGYGRPPVRPRVSARRRTIQVRLGLDLGFRIWDFGFLTAIDNVELKSSDLPLFSLVLTCFGANFQSAFRNPHSAIVDPVVGPSSWSRDSNS